MLGAYLAYQLSLWLGYWPALALGPLAVAGAGALLERWVLRRVHARGQVAELVTTFGAAWLIAEVVHLAWGRGPQDFRFPPGLAGTAFTLAGVPFPMARCFVIGVSTAMLLALWLAFAHTRLGLLLRAALARPAMLQALGHDVPRLHTAVFACGAGLAGLAGAIGGPMLVTEPGMADTLGAIIFVVVVVGGMGSLGGAFAASLAIGVLQTLAAATAGSLGGLAARLGVALPPSGIGADLGRVTLAEAAPALPYLFMLIVLALRPAGLMGTRTD
jgi:branched-chain amino acid transport system permease protein